MCISRCGNGILIPSSLKAASILNRKSLFISGSIKLFFIKKKTANCNAESPKSSNNTKGLGLLRIPFCSTIQDKNKFASIFSFLKYLIYILVVIGVLNGSGVDVTVFLTASAALFVGIGFALQTLFQDIISGIFIILDKTLRIGDVIEFDDGKVGRIFDIKLRTTRALTRDDKVIIIPNHKFLTDKVYNWTQNHKTTRESVKVGVAYGSDTQKVKEVLLSCIVEQKGILKSPKPFVLFEDFGDSALQFAVFFFIKNSFIDPEIKSDLRFKIDAAFREEGISIPFPQRDIHIINKKE